MLSPASIWKGNSSSLSTDTCMSLLLDLRLFCLLNSCLLSDKLVSEAADGSGAVAVSDAASLGKRVREEILESCLLHVDLSEDNLEGE